MAQVLLRYRPSGSALAFNDGYVVDCGMLANTMDDGCWMSGVTYMTRPCVSDMTHHVTHSVPSGAL